MTGLPLCRAWRAGTSARRAPNSQSARPRTCTRRWSGQTSSSIRRWPVVTQRTRASAALAEAHGYYRGLSPLHIQRNLILMLEVARAMERDCPEAWLIQASNPVFEGCTLMTRETGVKVVGLCHGYRGIERVANLLGLDPDLVTWQAPGFNHVIYLTEFCYEGESVYPLLDRWIETESERHWARTDLRYSASDLSRSAIDQYRRVGLLPLGDTSRGFETWWYNIDLETKRHWFGHLGGFDSEIGWQHYLDHLSEGVDENPPSRSGRGDANYEVDPACE